MSGNENFPQEMGSSTDDPHHFATSRNLPRQAVTQASIIENPPFLQSQFPFTTHARDEKTAEVAKSVNDAFSNWESGDRLDFGIPQKVFPEASGSGVISSNPVEYIEPMIGNQNFLRSRPTFKRRERIVQTFEVAKSVNDVFLNKEPGYSPDIRITTHFPQTVFPEASGSGVISSLPVQYMEPMIGNSYIHRSQPTFKTHAIIVPTFEATMNVRASSAKNNFVDDLPLCERNTAKHFKNEYLSSDEIENMRKRFESLPGGLSGNLQKADHVLSYGLEDKRSENDISLRGKGKDQYISDITRLNIDLQRLALSEGINPQLRNPDFIGEIDRTFPSQREEKHIENYISSRGKIEEHYIPNMPIIDNQFLAISETNDKLVRFTDSLSLHNSSSKYLQLYTERLPEDYDFAMNIMAFIEQLNDCSWKETISYFDEYVKRMFKYLWRSGLKDFLNNRLELQILHQSIYIGLIDKFSQSFECKKYDLSQFLNYCVIISKLGVTARKCNFEDVPMYVIKVLRVEIQERQNSQSIPFEITVINYAKKFVEVLKL